MRSNTCKMIEEIKGTKSTKIMELINRKLQDEKERMLSAHIADVQLKKFEAEFLELEKKLEEAKAKLDKRKQQLDLEWGSAYIGDKYVKGYKIINRCRITKQDYEQLQAAQDLYSIGKKPQANEIWVKMIEKHKLFR